MQASKKIPKSEIAFALFIVNTVCTLKCKSCITFTPYQKDKLNFSKENIIRDIDAFFEIWAGTPRIDFEGGETLLHPDVGELVMYVYSNYVKNGKCDQVRVLSNGTLLPGDDLIKAAKLISSENRDAFLFLFDNYGPELSVCKDELIHIFEEEKISYRVNEYYGESPTHGGWIDFGDLSLKNETREEIARKASSCHSVHDTGTGKIKPCIKDGKINLCNIQLSHPNHIELVKGEYIDLCDETIPFYEKMEIALNFGKNPINHCKYCNGYNVNGKRLKPAEQLG